MVTVTSRSPTASQTLVNLALTALVLAALPLLAVLGLTFQFLFVVLIPVLVFSVLLVPAVRRWTAERPGRDQRSGADGRVAKQRPDTKPKASPRGRFNGAVFWIVAAVVLLAAFPLLAITGLTFQLAFVVAVPAAVAVAVILMMVRSLRREKAVVHEKIRGVDVRPDVWFTSKHSWISEPFKGRRRLGVDDFMRRILGPVNAVVLPKKGDRLKAGQSMATLIHGRRRLAVKAPVDGKVVRVNYDVYADATLVNRDPYGEGWLVEFSAEGDFPAGQMLKAESAVGWMGREIDRLTSAVTTRLNGGVPSLADGGELLESYADHIDDDGFRGLVSEFFD